MKYDIGHFFNKFHPLLLQHECQGFNTQVQCTWAAIHLVSNGSILEKNKFSSNEWLQELNHSFQQYPNSSIGIYIQLPFCESLCTFCGYHKRITKNHSVESSL